MATSTIKKLISHEVYIEVKRGTAGDFPANQKGTFLASVIGIEPSVISGYTNMGTLLITNTIGCVADYSEDGYVNWQNITSTGRSGVQVIATHFYQRSV